MLTLIIFWSRISVRIQLNRNTDVIAPSSALNTAIITHKSLASPSVSCWNITKSNNNKKTHETFAKFNSVQLRIYALCTHIKNQLKQAKWKSKARTTKKVSKKMSWKQHSIHTLQVASSFLNLQFGWPSHTKSKSMHVSSSQSNSPCPQESVVFFPSAAFFFVNAV